MFVVFSLFFFRLLVFFWFLFAFVVEGSVERVLVMVTSSFLLFPFSRFPLLLVPRRGVEFKA